MDLSDQDVARPVLDFFALDAAKTRVMFSISFGLLYSQRCHAIGFIVCVTFVGEYLLGNVLKFWLTCFVV